MFCLCFRVSCVYRIVYRFCLFCLRFSRFRNCFDGVSGLGSLGSFPCLCCGGGCLRGTRFCFFGFRFYSFCFCGFRLGGIGLLIVGDASVI